MTLLGNSVLISEPPRSGKNLIWMMLKAARNPLYGIKGKVVVVTSSKNVERRVSYLTKLGISFRTVTNNK